MYGSRKIPSLGANAVNEKVIIKISISRKHAGAKNDRRLTSETESIYVQIQPAATDTVKIRMSKNKFPVNRLSRKINKISETQSPNAFDATKQRKLGFTHINSVNPNKSQHIESPFAFSHTLEFTAPKSILMVDLPDRKV